MTALSTSAQLLLSQLRQLPKAPHVVRDALLVTPRICTTTPPRRILRAGINLSNMLLVVGRAVETGVPVGVAPDMAAALAASLDAEVAFVPFANPGLLADAAKQGAYDVGFIGAEPERARVLRFTPPYCEIEATYLVRTSAQFTDPASVDREGVRIAVSARAAYDLWLSANLKRAELTRTAEPGLAGSLEGAA